MAIFKEFVKRYGLGMIISAATLDGYRRQVINDLNNNTLEKVSKERSELSESIREAYDRYLAEETLKSKNVAAIGRFKEAADEHQKAVEALNTEGSEYNKNELNRTKNKLEKSFDEIKELNIMEFVSSLYNRYTEYLDSLTPDKIACLFYIIVDGLILSSFISVLSIMLSVNIINKIGFLEKYPKILKLIQLRNIINKKVSKVYLFLHFIIITFAILGNIWMFFI